MFWRTCSLWANVLKLFIPADLLCSRVGTRYGPKCTCAESASTTLPAWKSQQQACLTPSLAHTLFFSPGSSPGIASISKVHIPPHLSSLSLWEMPQHLLPSFISPPPYMQGERKHHQTGCPHCPGQTSLAKAVFPSPSSLIPQKTKARRDAKERPLIRLKS